MCQTAFTNIPPLRMPRNMPRRSVPHDERGGPAYWFFMTNVGLPFLVWRAGWRPEWLLPAWCMWLVQMLGVLLVYHRLFSHRGFDTSRPFAFALACLGMCAGQGGPIFWAGMHRHHHKKCEEETDVHSPLEYGDTLHPVLRFLYAQSGPGPHTAHCPRTARTPCTSPPPALGAPPSSGAPRVAQVGLPPPHRPPPSSRWQFALH